MTRRNRTAAAAAALVLALGFAAPARAQVFTGRVDVSIEDSTGAPLGRRHGGADRPDRPAQTSDAQGQAHFAESAGRHLRHHGHHAGVPPSTTGNVEVLSGERTPLVVRDERRWRSGDRQPHGR